MTGEHEELVIELVDGGFTVACLCGWMGQRYENEEDAAEAWENHCDVVFMDACAEQGEP